MGENRNITWNVTLKTNPNVTPYDLYLVTPVSLKHGKWALEPPTEIKGAKAGAETVTSFKAEGRDFSTYGVEGSVLYSSQDSIQDPTVFEFTFSIPLFDANSGNLAFKSGMANGTYNIDDGGGVPPSGGSITVDVTITQVKPDI